ESENRAKQTIPVKERTLERPLEARATTWGLKKGSDLFELRPWMLLPMQNRGSFMLVNSSQHAGGQRAQLLMRTLSENDTHCVQFSYFLYSRDGHSPGTLRVFVRVNGGPLGSPVWNISGSCGQQWHQVELAVSTFWPSDYQVLFEATVSAERQGYIALDDILLLNYPCYKVPHFSRLGDVEVNTGQNATFQCVASGRVSEAEQFLLERHNGAVELVSSVQKTSHRRYVATFQLDGAVHVGQRVEQQVEQRVRQWAGHNQYRCISSSPRGAAVSNFADLIVKGGVVQTPIFLCRCQFSLPVPPTPTEAPQLLRAGSTYLIIQLNTDSMVGDGPVIRREIEYRSGLSPWSEVHGVSASTYKVWHLEPDTEYRIGVLLTRPGEGGTGRPGPPLVSRTKCAEPMRAIRGLAATEIQSRQLSLQWEPLGYNLTRCHSYTVSLCYRYSTTGGAGVHNATVRECLAVEQDTPRLTLRDLPPYRPVHVRLALANPEGRKESREVTFQTEEDVPGGIATESLTFTPLDDMVFLKWEEPVEPNGLITQYEISYQSIESSDPGVNVPGPRRTVSKLRNETYHMFSGLQPGTTYLVSVRARTAKGFGLTALTEITTNISGTLRGAPSAREGPGFRRSVFAANLERAPSDLETFLLCVPGLSPVITPPTVHSVVVEEEGVEQRGGDPSRQVKRELGKQECFVSPASRGDGRTGGEHAYCTAELPPSSVAEATPFTVGDNRTYNGYWNMPLDPAHNYAIYFQATSHFRGVSTAAARSALSVPVAVSGRKASRSTGRLTANHRRAEMAVTRLACRDHREALEVSQHSEDVGLIAGGCAGGLLLLTLLLGLVVLLLRRSRDALSVRKAPMSYRPEKVQSKGRGSLEQSRVAEESRAALPFVDPHGCAARHEQRHLMNESSSLLVRSPRRPCAHKTSAYPTGQLRPAVRVADLLQHISQMKTAEGYGFKQEYEVKGRGSALGHAQQEFGADCLQRRTWYSGRWGLGGGSLDRGGREPRLKLHKGAAEELEHGYHRSNHFIAT
ncbi:hypothetical protein Z043_125202, partial [Scleropages formosus]